MTSSPSTTLGKFIRNEVGLWSDNIPLLLDCQRVKERNEPALPTIQLDDASMVIVEVLWRRLRENIRITTDHNVEQMNE